MTQISLDDLVVVDTESWGGGAFGELHELWSISWKSKDMSEPECILGRWKPDSEEDRARLQQDWEKILNGKIPVFHNAAHDVVVLRQMGLTVDVYHCTMIMGYNLNPDMKLLSRPGMKPSKYGIDAWGIRMGLPKLEHPKWEEWMKEETFFEELPIYNKRDVEIGWGILEKCRVLELLQRDGLAWDYYCNIDLPFIEVIIELNSVGLYLDFDILAEWQKELEQEKELLEEQLREMAAPVPSFQGKKTWHKTKHDDKDGYYTGEYREDKGWEFIFNSEFNPGSDMHVKQVYKQIYGESIANVQEDYLTDKFGHLPFTQVFIEYKKLCKLINTYCIPFQVKADKYGFITAQFKQMCITGRLSCEKPNLQNLPSRDERGATFRRFVTAPPGYKIVRVDLSNIELRVMTALQAQYFTEKRGYIPDDIQKIVDVFWNDPETPEGDYHGVMTTLWFGIDHTHPDFKRIRNAISKHITFARTYGAGITRLAAQMKVDYATAKERKVLADKANPSFNQFRQWIVDEFYEGGGFGHTYFGRRLNYPSFTLNSDPMGEVQELKNGEVIPPELASWRIAKGERQAFNAKGGQGTAADILKMICVALLPHVWAMNARLACQIHDELLFYVPEDVVEEFKQLVSLAVNRDDILPFVPIRGTPTHGNNWLECKD